MRTNQIGKAISQLLDKNELKEAFVQFRDECDHIQTCPYSKNENNCVVLCLMPKLIHLSLGTDNIVVDGRIEAIRKDMNSIASRSFRTILNAQVAVDSNNASDEADLSAHEDCRGD